MTAASKSAGRNVYRRLLPYARPYRGRVILGAVAGVILSFSLFGMLSNMSVLLQELTRQNALVGQATATNAPPPVAAPTPSPSSPEAENPTLERLGAAGDILERFGIPAEDEQGRMTLEFLIIAGVLLVACVVLRAITVFANRYCMRWVGSRVVVDLRNDLFEHLVRQSLSFYGKSDVGQLISRTTNDTAIVERVVAFTIADLTRAPFEVAAPLIFVVYFAIEKNMLGLVAAVALGFPLIILPITLFGRKVKRHTRRALERISLVVSRMHETFTGIRVVQAFNMEKAEYESFRDTGFTYFHSIIKALRAELLIAPTMEAVGITLAVGFLIACFLLQVRLAQVLAIGAGAVLVYRPIKLLSRIGPNVERGAAALERIFDLLDQDTSLPQSPNPVKPTGFDHSIEFEKVDFAYDEDASPTVEHIQLSVPKGSVIALVGETGSGKTTLANLLCRFYDPTAGRVTLDGVDLRNIDIPALRKLIGIVTQETILFNDTVASNIAYGTPNATQEQIEAAARQANAHDFIMAQPEGYDRVVGEKGTRLSGGEKQRVAIARAILKNPPILVLDEATSALDTVTERLVQEAISHVMKDRTVLAIAHRLSTIRHADQICLLDQGRIVERGTHDELMAAGGRYRRLCDMQVLDA